MEILIEKHLKLLVFNIDVELSGSTNQDDAKKKTDEPGASNPRAVKNEIDTHESLQEPLL